MPFEITIIETSNKNVPRQEWATTGKNEAGREEYGWTPPAPDTVKVETIRIKRLEQTVETIDLPSVIKAINGIA